MNCSPPPATSASAMASCISPWLRSARPIEHRPPRRSVGYSTKRRQSTPALACGFASQRVRHRASGLPSPARRPSAAPPRPSRLPDRRQNRTFVRYAMSGGLNLRLELLRYETHTYPDIGQAQDVINRQIKVDYDILIGVMWKR